jgi:hypothetical protein
VSGFRVYTIEFADESENTFSTGGAQENERAARQECTAVLLFCFLSQNDMMDRNVTKQNRLTKINENFIKIILKEETLHFLILFNFLLVCSIEPNFLPNCY